MRRKIYSSLLKWKNSSRRKPLVLLGARQVGKTYILKEFGKREYDSYLYINCHKNPFAATLFESDFDMERVLVMLEAYTGIKPHENSSLIIFDEIQEIPDGIASLKYFCENLPEFHVAVAGSLLGISLRTGESFPVGKIDTLRMYPMGFEEFLWAMNEEPLAKLIADKSFDVISSLHNRLTSLLRLYYFIGGMPEALKAYIDGASLAEVRKIQKELLDAYYSDIAKHTALYAEKIRMVWNYVPRQLAKENKKFIFGAVRKGARARDFEEAIQWLIDAGLIICVRLVHECIPPLKFYADENAFKVFLLDVGLLGAMLEAEANEIITGENVFREYKGAFTENYVAQQLQLALDSSPFYFSSDNPRMEIDFIFSIGSKITALEVKAEQNVRSKSLHTFFELQKNSGVVCRALRLSMLPYKEQDWMTNIPLFSLFGEVGK